MLAIVCDISDLVFMLPEVRYKDGQVRMHGRCLELGESEHDPKWELGAQRSAYQIG